MMAQQVPAKPQASDSRSQRNSAIQQQIFKPSSAVAAATGGILNAHPKFARAYERRKFQSPHQRPHGGESIAKQRHAAIDHESVNAIRGHAAAHARLSFENQRLKTPIFQADRRAKPGNPASDYDHICVAAC
jgi:hypothetical protein